MAPMAHPIAIVTICDSAIVAVIAIVVIFANERHSVPLIWDSGDTIDNGGTVENEDTVCSADNGVIISTMSSLSRIRETA